MAPLIKHHETREAPEQLPGTHDALPALPEDVTVPEDLSTLELPASMRPSRAATGVRWLRWVPLLVVLAAGAVVAALLLSGRGTETAPTTQTLTAMNMIQEEIDLALAEQAAAQVTAQPSAAAIIQAEIDEAVRMLSAPAAVIIQREVDEALVAFEAREALLLSGARAQLPVTPAAAIVQAEIDEAVRMLDASAAEIIRAEIDKALEALDTA